MRPRPETPHQRQQRPVLKVTHASSSTGSGQAGATTAAAAGPHIPCAPDTSLLLLREAYLGSVASVLALLSTGADVNTQADVREVLTPTPTSIPASAAGKKVELITPLW